MTLEDYTNFVFTLGRDLGIISSLQAGPVKTRAISSLEDSLNRDLQFLMGYSNWEKFTALFYDKIGRSEESKHKTVFVARIYENQEIFWPTLAEFCEPLIIKATQKSEGGQDATS